MTKLPKLRKSSPPPNKELSLSSQIDKFKEAARKAETDDSEEAFDRALKQVAKSTGKISR